VRQLPWARNLLILSRLQRALVANLRQFLLELGSDLTFVGERYRLQVDGRDFFVDSTATDLINQGTPLGKNPYYTPPRSRFDFLPRNPPLINMDH
jgi:hypothetical protein